MQGPRPGRRQEEQIRPVSITSFCRCCSCCLSGKEKQGGFFIFWGDRKSFLSSLLLRERRNLSPFISASPPPPPPPRQMAPPRPRCLSLLWKRKRRKLRAKKWKRWRWERNKLLQHPFFPFSLFFPKVQFPTFHKKMVRKGSFRVPPLKSNFFPSGCCRSIFREKKKRDRLHDDPKKMTLPSCFPL